MACNVNDVLEVCYSECSEQNDHKSISSSEEDFETVEMVLLGENSRHISTDKPVQRNTFVRNKRSTATLRVLSSMPSRSVGWSGAVVLSHGGHSSQRNCYQASNASNNKNVMECHKVPQRKNLLKTLQALSADECVRKLRTVPLHFTEKRDLRALTCHKRGSEVLCATASRSPFQAYLGKSLHSAHQCILSLLNSVHLWHGALKQVSDRFGTGALSYFLFLRSLLLYNTFLSFITILFLILPQVIHHPHHSLNKIHFTGLEIFTGTGVLTNSLMFYGYYNYTNGKTCIFNNQSEPCSAGAYNIRLAYFVTVGIGLFVTCIMLVYSVFKALGRSIHTFKSQGNFALKVFSSWDFKVSKTVSVQLQSENLCTQLKEMLCEQCVKPKQHLTTRLIWLALHCTAWGICLTCIFCCVLAIYVFSRDRDQVNINGSLAQEALLLALPLLVCCLNHLLPSVFNMVAWMESYDSPNFCIYVAIIRNLILKVSTLGVLSYHWLESVATERTNKKIECWETFVGQELYRFLLMDLIFCLLYTIIGDFLWRVFTQGALKRKRKPAFDIAQNVLELIYGQTLAWVGLLFTPLLPTIQIVKLFLIFYIKMASLMMNCQAPKKPWRATQMTTLFISLLCFPSFLGAVACITYTMWRLVPSSSCGPFRTLHSMFLAGEEWRSSLESSGLIWLSWAYKLLENPLFLFLAAGFILLLIYIQIQIGDGQRRIKGMLHKQIENEGEDKKFLISKLQAFQEQQDQ